MEVLLGYKTGAQTEGPAGTALRTRWQRQCREFPRGFGGRRAGGMREAAGEIEAELGWGGHTEGASSGAELEEGPDRTGWSRGPGGREGRLTASLCFRCGRGLGASLRLVFQSHVRMA